MQSHVLMIKELFAQRLFFSPNLNVYLEKKFKKNGQKDDLWIAAKHFIIYGINFRTASGKKFKAEFEAVKRSK